MSKEKIKIAIIGCGRFSQFFVPLFKAHPSVEDVYVCDLKRERAEEFSKRFDVKIVDSFEEWDFCQIQLNYLDTKYQAGIKGMKYAAEKGLGIIVMEPLRGGRLVKGLPERVKSVLPVKKSMVELALDYLWDREEVALVLSGMSTPKQVEDNL